MRERKAILQRRYELAYFPKVSKAIAERVSSLIEIVRQDGLSAAYDHLYRETDSKSLGKVIGDMYQKVGLRFARMQWSELLNQQRGAKKSAVREQQTKGFGFNATWVEFIKDYLTRFLLEKIVFKVAETTRNRILSVLSEAIEKGWGIEEAVKELNEIPRRQAARIVRTEITRAANTGTMAAGSTFEYEQNKEWMSAHDKRTRGVDPEDHASHIGLDGQTVDYDEHFTDPRNGDKLMFPGDPEAKGESTINCRCSVAIVARFDQNGRLIPKKRL